MNRTKTRVAGKTYKQALFFAKTLYGLKNVRVFPRKLGGFYAYGWKTIPKSLRPKKNRKGA